jgi:hypothetical protein
MTRSLRILRWAVSLVGVIGVALFGVFWVRSYWRADSATIPRRGTQVFIIFSNQGSMAWYTRFHERRGQKLSWELRSNPGYILPPGEQADLSRNLRLIRVVRGKSVTLPHWVLMLACAIVGAAPWLRWRFSVRGVLVFMAFIAAMFAILIFE